MKLFVERVGADHSVIKSLAVMKNPALQVLLLRTIWWLSITAQRCNSMGLNYSLTELAQWRFGHALESVKFKLLDMARYCVLGFQESFERPRRMFLKVIPQKVDPTGNLSKKKDRQMGPSFKSSRNMYFNDIYLSFISACKNLTDKTKTCLLSALLQVYGSYVN